MKEFKATFWAVEVMKQTIMDAYPILDWSMQMDWDVDKTPCI